MTIDLSERLTEHTTAALELLAVHIGRELGLYATLDRHGPLTAPQLAERAGIDARYAREWLEQQAVAGFLHIDSHIDGHTDRQTDGHIGDQSDDLAVRPTPKPGDRRFALPEAHRGALVDPIDGGHVAPFAGSVVAIAQAMDDVVAAYRTGAGVPYTRYGATFRRGQGDINRPAFTSDLVKAWLPAVEGVADRLAAGGRLLDVGAGHGWSTIAVQAEWPAAEVVGLDADEASVDEARARATDAGVTARFAVVDPSGSDLGAHGPADVALVLEALHDMADPVGVLAAIRATLTPGGVVVVADEAVAEEFTAPGDDLERMMYGWSVSHCLPAARAESPSAALGTVLRPATVVDLARQAGFTDCAVVDVDAGFFRLYRLTA